MENEKVRRWAGLIGRCEMGDSKRVENQDLALDLLAERLLDDEVFIDKLVAKIAARISNERAGSVASICAESHRMLNEVQKDMYWAKGS